MDPSSIITCIFFPSPASFHQLTSALTLRYCTCIIRHYISYPQYRNLRYPNVHLPLHHHPTPNKEGSLITYISPFSYISTALVRVSSSQSSWRKSCLMTSPLALFFLRSHRVQDLEHQPWYASRRWFNLDGSYLYIHHIQLPEAPQHEHSLTIIILQPVIAIVVESATIYTYVLFVSRSSVRRFTDILNCPLSNSHRAFELRSPIKLLPASASAFASQVLHLRNFDLLRRGYECPGPSIGRREFLLHFLSRFLPSFLLAQSIHVN